VSFKKVIKEIKFEFEGSRGQPRRRPFPFGIFLIDEKVRPTMFLLL